MYLKNTIGIGGQVQASALGRAAQPFYKWLRLSLASLCLGWALAR